jgi:hypothetical protein
MDILFCFNSLLTQADLLIDCFVYCFQAQTNTYPHVSKQCLDEGGCRRLLPLPPPPPIQLPKTVSAVAATTVRVRITGSKN